MPYEMANFVTDQTDFSIVTRSGGDIELVKRLIAADSRAGREGYYEADYTGKVAWLGTTFTPRLRRAERRVHRAGCLFATGKDMRVEYRL